MPPELQILGEELRRELQTTIDRILDVTGQSRLFQNHPEGRLAVEARNPYIDPINLLQVDLLRRWRESGRQDRELFEALLACIAGIAEGLQSTG